jgi:hypothetical protein
MFICSHVVMSPSPRLFGDAPAPQPPPFLDGMSTPRISHRDRSPSPAREALVLEADSLAMDPLLDDAEAALVAAALETLSHYCGAGIEDELIAPLPRETVVAMMGRVLFPAALPQATVDRLMEALLREVVSDYFAAAKLSCVRYILMDEEESERLGMSHLPPGPVTRPPRVLPSSLHASIMHARDRLVRHLGVTDPRTESLLRLFHKHAASTSLLASPPPDVKRPVVLVTYAHETKDHCTAVVERLMNEWYPEVLLLYKAPHGEAARYAL